MARRTTTARQSLNLVAEILATGILRRRLRDVCNILNMNDNLEIDLEVSPGQSLHPVEPQRRRKK